MKIDDIKHLAHLARIQVSDQEAEGLLNDLTATLAYIDQIREANLTDDELVVGDNHNVARADVVAQTADADRAIILDNVQSKQDGFVKVNKIL